MADHTEYYLDPALEKMFHDDLSRLDLHDHDDDSNDIIGAHLPEWLIGVIIVIIMLLVAFFVMVITSLIKKRKKNQSLLPASTISSAVVCDDLESGKIGQCDDSHSKTTILSCNLQGQPGDNSCPPEKDFTSTSHKALQEVSNQAGCSCQNPLFVDDEEHDPGDTEPTLEVEGEDASKGEALSEAERSSESESSQSKGSPHKHKSSKVMSTGEDNEITTTTTNSTHNSPTNSSKFFGNIKKIESEMNLHETKPDLTRFSCQLGDSMINEICHSISSCSDGGGEEENKDRDSINNCTSLSSPAVENQETTAQGHVAECNGIEGAMKSLDVLGAVCDDEGIEKDTGIISTCSREKPGHVLNGSSSSNEDKLWSSCNGNSPQEHASNSNHLTPSNNAKSKEIVSVDPDTTLPTISSSSHPNPNEDTADSLSTNL